MAGGFHLAGEAALKRWGTHARSHLVSGVSLIGVYRSPDLRAASGVCVTRYQARPRGADDDEPRPITFPHAGGAAIPSRPRPGSRPPLSAETNLMPWDATIADVILRMLSEREPRMAEIAVMQWIEDGPERAKAMVLQMSRAAYRAALDELRFAVGMQVEQATHGLAAARLVGVLTGLSKQGQNQGYSATVE